MKRIAGGTIVVLSLILLSAAARLFPHPANVSPIAAIALLGGASLHLPWALAAPGAAMLLSDLVIGFDRLPITLSVYGSFFASVFLGRWLRGRSSPWRTLGTALASSILFYLVTNAAVWWFSGLYAQTFDGLMLSYFYAIPFFRHTLLGDLGYTVALFWAYEYAPRLAIFSFRHQQSPSRQHVSVR
ncbi:MAG: hypothetical protein G01um101438_537 [Parcubacteria group bacterium Gr01-1014_38]|nr:MAG: hypothetical protein G01um101438_537 [Parcubacteria group bacterium Gr01-1014_38]